MIASANKTIPYDSDQHRLILARLQDRITRSRNSMSDRYTKWEQNEEQYLAYMPVKVNDELRKAARHVGEPQFTTIEIPYSYAILLTAHTYITSTLLARSPVQQVSGRHGESQQSEAAIEALLDYQLQTGGQLVPMYVWTLDSLKYGIGIMGYFWEEEKQTITKVLDVQKTFMGMPLPGKFKKETVSEVVDGYQGTRAYNVRPQDFFPDPAYPANQFQKGEFCARYAEISMLDILDGEGAGDYFNVDKLKENRKGGAGSQRVMSSSQVTLPGQNMLVSNVNDDDECSGVVHLHEVYVRIIPRDWGLGLGTVSEKWVFTLAENAVIIAVKPLGYYHNRFPFEVLEQEIDGHALFARSMLEVTKPLNDTLTWLINTHFFNVRKSLNDQFVVDPSKIVMKDMTDPNPGRLIRLKPAAYGQDVRGAVTQLPVQDITRAHLTDAQLITDMLQRVTGVNDSLMGMVNAGRKTATEVRSSTTFGINRLKTVTEYMSAMGFSSWTQQIIQVTQQLYDNDRSFKIVGDLATWGEKYMQVTPEQIAGFYDFVPVDGTLPVDRFAQVNLWKTLMEQAVAMPQIMQQYDFGKIFAFVAQLAGIKNIAQFRVQVVPDATMQGQAAAGNVVPMKPGMAPDQMSQAGEPGQIPGMGATL